MLYNYKKKKTKIGIEKAKRILEKFQFKVKNIYSKGVSYTNNVYFFDSNNKKYVLKFFTDQWKDKNAGVREYKIMKELRKNEIPVPKVILFKIANKNSPRNFMIMERLEGSPLYKKSKKTDIKIIKESLNILKKFSEIKGKFGFYEHDKKVHNTYDSHFDFINDGTFYAIKKMKDLGYNVGNLKKLFAETKKYDSQKKEFSFTHCDFTPKHIFIKNNKIMGIIDFEWAIFSEPINDATLFLISLSEYGFQEEHIKEVYNYCISTEQINKIAYYVARAYILKAAWPHKKVKQPEYSQTCLNRAKTILKKGKIELKDIFWPKELISMGE